MIYQNPIIRGFYPDPSVCMANEKFYLVTSSFQYFPGVPLFESDDLVNWKQIGHVFTRKSQVMLDKVRSSGGVFAPTIRFYDGRFYMVTNNNSTNKNFYVYTDDIYGEWSEPIEVDQDGIDPSLYFENGHAFFITNGYDEESGDSGVIQCEIDINSGAKLSESKCIWCGAGGRYLESPHMYKIGEYYYLMVAEGGTEYGHMISYSRSKNIWGPFENYPNNPVLTNRDKAPYIIQAIGHGDLIQNLDGSWYMISLGFRQTGEWMPFHHLGREVYMTPVSFNNDGWFTCGNGSTVFEYEIPGDFIQTRKNTYTFENTDWNIDWCYLRYMHPENYELSDNSIKLTGTDITLEDVDSPTFIGIRQIDFDAEIAAEVSISSNLSVDSEPDTLTDIDSKIVNNLSNSDVSLHESGITLYMDENEHYDICIQKNANSYNAVLKLNIGTAKHTEKIIPLSSNTAKLIVRSNSLEYKFYVSDNGTEKYLGMGRSKYLSSEVAEGFTGTIIGLYAIGPVTATITNFICNYN